MRASSLSSPSLMYALAQLPAITGWWIRNEVYERGTRKGIGISCHRRSVRDDSEGQEVLAAVVADAHDLIGLGICACEIRELDIRSLARAMAGPQLGERRRLHYGIRSLGRARRSVIGFSATADAGFSTVLGGGWGRG